MDQDKEAGEKEEGCPFHMLERFFQFVAIGCQEHHDSTNKGNPRNCNVRDWVEEEVENNNCQDGPAYSEHCDILDAIFGLKFSNVADTGSCKFFTVEPLNEHEAWNDCHQNTGCHLNDEIVECNARTHQIRIPCFFNCCSR